MQKLNIDKDFIPFRRINSECIIDLNVTCNKSIEVLYSIRDNLGDHGFGDQLLDTTLKAWSIEEKN